MYHYETLGDERFQELCQALIAVDNPDAQCLPVGQPDGGRDAFLQRQLLDLRGVGSDLTVFQVKFSKSATERSDRDMIAEVVKSEKRKVDRLKALGLRKYILVTNVRGTAHLDVGSVDKVNVELSKMLGVDAYCWWRDDLDRRLDAASDVKWSYPEVLKATDLLEVLVRGQLGDEEDRRRNAIRAYLTSQYDDDRELKFKQTDLRSTMTELFVDLPMSETLVGGPEEVVHVHRSSGRLYRNRFSPSWYREARHAAEFLLSSYKTSRYSRILLEGAPGQGKSTVTQYVCQLLRMLMLDKHADLATLPKVHQTFMARLPFRVDLRDLAKWLGGMDPFQSKPLALDEREPKSLEGFLAAQVRHASGGASFNVSDLIAVAKASHIFLALDGFDEVADVAMRNILVTEISKATSRLLNAGGFSVQAVVTSRPAAFAKSVRFPREQWSYFELLPLERPHVDAYTEKWMRAKSLKSAERQTLVRVLNAKLEEAHTQYLAKNPMQLTILLSLINNRGSSLPEKRTAMYDAYMDMFFSRESEKSDIVRDNRELLIDIHRYLAWKLQTGAEGGGDGSIEHGDLRSTLFAYLDSQSEDTSIVNALFSGIIERVGALVSRVQETYEFEVQPLREYFAARHLYETAPYSPVGDEKKGTKLDRFQALVRNPYWLNVARFYGGCFSKGEVSALVDELTLIAESGDYCQTSHPRMVALMFLSDWVFTQYQPAVKRIVELICEHPAFRQLLAAEQVGSLAWAPLPERSGRQEFLDRLWERFVASTKSDERAALAIALGQHATLAERTELWVTLAKDRLLDDWISLGETLGVFRDDADRALPHLPSKPTPHVVQCLFDAGRFDLLARDQEMKSEANASLLSGRYTPKAIIHRHPANTEEYWTAKILNLYQYGLPFMESGGMPLFHALESRLATVSSRPPLADALSASEATNPQEAYQAFLSIPTSVLASSTAPWSDLVETLRKSYGDCTAIDRIAVVAAGVRAKGVLGSSEPFSDTRDLVGSFRYARMKSGAPQWWKQQLESAENTSDLLRYLLVFWVWATPRTMFALGLEIDHLLKNLDATDWDILRAGHNFCRVYSAGPKAFDRLEKGDLAKLSGLGCRAATMVGSRLTGAVRYRVVKPILADETSEQSELGFAMDAVYRSLREEPQWTAMLADIRAIYARGATLRSATRREDFSMSHEVATEVLSSLEGYPLLLVAAADAVLKARIGESTPKLADVAQQERWFN